MCVAAASDDRAFFDASKAGGRLARSGDADRGVYCLGAVDRLSGFGCDPGGVTGEVDRDTFGPECLSGRACCSEDNLARIDWIAVCNRCLDRHPEMFEHGRCGLDSSGGTGLFGDESPGRLAGHVVCHVVMADILPEPSVDLIAREHYSGPASADAVGVSSSCWGSR